MQIKEDSQMFLNNNELEINTNEQKAIDRVFTKKRSRENYCKLNEEKNEILEAWFTKIRYPKKDDYETIAQQINEIVPKIENWFKHQRRKAMIEGNLNLYKRRKLLNEKEKSVLEETFRYTMHPNKEKLHELAKQLKFSTKVISNWFSYRRKKFLKINTFQASSKYERKAFKNKQIFSHDGSSPQSINLNGSGSDFSLNLKNDNQPNTNCTGPSESNTNGKNSSNNNKSDNNENDHPKKMKKVHCEEQNFQSQSNEYKTSSMDYLKNCQNFSNFFVKNNGIPAIFNNRQNITQNIQPAYGYTNNLSQNGQNYYQINQNPMNLQNYSNNIGRNYPIYTPVMVMGQDCIYQYMPVIQQQMVMGYPTAQPTAFYPNAMNKMNYMQPMMNINGFYQQNANMNGFKMMNHKFEENRMEGKE